MPPKEYALIVAGGKGTRFKNRLPKQFIELDGKPIVLRTIEAFYRYSKKITIVLVIPGPDFTTWKRICKKFKFTKPVVLQSGGLTRFQSVKKGLEMIEGDGLVAIHDGVRPFVTEKMIKSSFRLAERDQCAIAAVPLKDSIRATADKVIAVSRDNDSKAADRTHFVLIQTPQTFDVALIRKAYQMREDSSLTDDAGVAENAGHRISLYEGDYKNIKITTPEDLIIAKALLKQKS